jgi:flagellin
MSLRINNNMSAATAHRMMSANDSAMSKSIERLSSGLRINSAADNAAGLVISETMRTNSSGLKQAMNNTQDGVNMIKTTEAALNEIETQLRNIRDLTLHAANANGNTEALAADQAQINQALTSIDRIADNTEFAGRKLLGTGAGNNINGVLFQIGANSGQTATFDLTGITFAGASVGGDMHASALGVSNAATAATAAKVTASTATSATGVATDEILTITGALGTKAVTLAAATETTPGAIVTAINAQSANTGVKAYLTQADGSISAFSADNTYLTFVSVDAAGNEEAGSTQTIVVSSNKAAANGSGVGTVSISDTGTSAGSYNVQTASSSDFQTLITAVDTAMKKVNGLRVNLGAFQANTLESNLNSITVAQENVQASESSIRDTDMAAEMVTFTKSQILTQAAQAMMTQANQAPQSILQMLR